jgi:hypothetical protein
MTPDGRHRLGRYATGVLALLWLIEIEAGWACAGSISHSSLVTNGGGSIRDDDFAGLIKGLLIKNGKSNALDAKFFFQECFGGGMLNDLKGALGDEVKWVGGSASRADEVSWGQEGSKPGDFWTMVLTPQLSNSKQTVAQAITNAIKNDQAGPGNKGGISPPEHGVLVTANGGGDIKLKDPAAKSYHAILWAGLTNGARFANDIRNMQNVLQTAWKGANFTITTLFGNGSTLGTIAATRDNLVKTLAALAKVMNPNEEFVFYASDHGDSEKTKTGPVRVPAKKNDVESFTLANGELFGILHSPNSLPELTVSYSALTAPSPVDFNGTQLGLLNPGLSSITFDVPKGLIGLDNTVTILNNGDTDFTINMKNFTTGPVGTIMIPEPPTLVMTGLGIGLVLLVTRRRGLLAA